MFSWKSLAAVLAFASLVGCGQATGVPTNRSLSSTASVQPGDECANGGQMVLTGIDLNGDGILQPNEIQQTAYLCSEQSQPPTCTTWEGDRVIASAADWASLAADGCTRITGTLEITATDVAAFEQPSPLVQVGAIRISNNAALASLRLPMLTTVDGNVRVEYSPLFTELDLPSLTSVGGELVAFVTPALARLNVPVLTTVGTVLQAYQSSLVIQHFPSLVSARNLAFSDNAQLAELSLPALTSIETLEASNDPALTTLHLPALQTIPAYGYLRIAQSPALTALSLPALTSTPELSLDWVTSLATLELPSLATVGTLHVWYADPLTALDLPELTSADEVGVSFRQGVADANGFRPILTALTQFSAPKLVSVNGKLQLGGAVMLERLDLSSLATVGGNLDVTMPNPSGRVDPDLPGSAAVYSQQSVLQSLSLPSLTKVGGELWINGMAAMTTFEAPVLAQVGVFVFTNNGLLAAVSLPELAKIQWTNWDDSSLDAGLTFRGNAAMAAIDAPKLAGNATLDFTSNPALTAVSLPSVTGTLSATITKNDHLASLSFPAASAINDLEVTLNPALTTLSLPSALKGYYLTVANNPLLADLQLPQVNRVTGGFSLSGNGALTAFGLPALTEIYGGSLAIKGNASLASVDLHSLGTVKYSNYGLTIADLPALTTLDLSSLTSAAGPFGIYNDPLFPNCQAQAIFDRLAYPKPTPVNIGANDMTAICTP